MAECRWSVGWNWLLCVLSLPHILKSYILVCLHFQIWGTTSYAHSQLMDTGEWIICMSTSQKPLFTVTSNPGEGWCQLLVNAVKITLIWHGDPFRLIHIVIIFTVVDWVLWGRMNLYLWMWEEFTAILVNGFTRHRRGLPWTKNAEIGCLGLHAYLKEPDDSCWSWQMFAFDWMHLECIQQWAHACLFSLVVRVEG